MSSAQSYTTPVESDTELQNVGTANDIKIDDHEALLTPVATPALSSTSVMVDSNETSYNQRKKEPKIAEQHNDKQAIPLALTTLDITDDEDETTDKKSAVAEKLVEDMKNDVQNKPLCVPGVEKTAESSNKENNKFLSPSMIYESYDESTKCMGEIETDDKKAQFTVKQHVPSQKQSSNAKETIDKKSDVEKVVKPPEVLFGEKKVEVLGQNFLEEISEDENHVKTGDLKNIAKTHTTAASSSSSSDEEEKKPKLVPPKVNKSTIKPTPVKKKVVVQKPKPVEELSELKSNNRLLEVGLLDDDDSEDDVDKNVKKPTTTSLSNQAKEKNPSKSTSKQDSCALNHGVLADTSDEDQSDVEEVSESDEDKPPVLPLSGASATLPHICLSGASSSEDETVNKYSSSNKKVKSKSIESVKNVRFLNEKYVKRSGSESEGEQFVSLEPTKSEDSYRIDIDKKLVSIDYEEKNSDDSDDEVLSSDDEGPSSLEVSDDDTQQPQDAGYLEQDLMESLDKQIAKEEEGKKREEKLQELAKKKKEYEKQGPTENGVTRLENYFDNFIIDIEPAKTESPNEAAAVVEKSKSPPEAAQPSKPIEVKKSKSKSPAKEQVVIKVIEGKKEESKPIAKTEIQKPQVESKKEAVKLKEVKVSSIGKYDPSIPIVGEDFIDQISCSEEVVTVKKATPIKTAANKPTSIQPSTVSQTSNAVQRPDPVVEDDFLVEIQASNLAQRPTPTCCCCGR
uniref:Uncharacterized protein n=1 Tax=Panagrolaimus superbus TaxID=310955 RepID=A0A914Z8G0_9BILA